MTEHEVAEAAQARIGGYGAACHNNNKSLVRIKESGDPERGTVGGENRGRNTETETRRRGLKGDGRMSRLC